MGKKSQIISDPMEISKYLQDEGSKQSAIGIGNIATWSNVQCKDAQSVRTAIIDCANEPIVEPKDEWDICLDSGMAYPHKSKGKSNPFKDFDRALYKNEFQSVQMENKRRRMSKKKGFAHNKNRFHRRRQKAMEA